MTATEKPELGPGRNTGKQRSQSHYPALPAAPSSSPPATSPLLSPTRSPQLVVPPRPPWGSPDAARTFRVHQHSPQACSSSSSQWLALHVGGHHSTQPAPAAALGHEQVPSPDPYSPLLCRILASRLASRLSQDRMLLKLQSATALLKGPPRLPSTLRTNSGS